ncbi:hypothetical protein [Clostridium sp. BJN0001]|uniref:hypothetical protein n=1 Tax=Clostridium sp. BJN0001 TaxID=2930219 RepID=UPI001FD5EF34|nr:hypothetical protein [Clostridium sp. BJN0001]
MIDCTAANREEHDSILEELQNLSNEHNGLKKVFEKINDNEFAKKCSNVFLQLPCKSGIILDDSKFDSIVVRDSRGFGDIGDSDGFSMDNISLTDDVNTILFFSISSIQQPIVFKRIIDEIMKQNLKTPMILMRRDEDLTQNDEDFKKNILNNLNNNDRELHDIVNNIKKNNKYQLNELVFQLPEVKKWKGTLKVDNNKHKEQVENFFKATSEVIEYCMEMYDELYNAIVNKMQGVYQDLFVDNILNKLLCETAYQAVITVVDKPYCKPGKNYFADRDTAALVKPVQLVDVEKKQRVPFNNEVSKRGNKYSDGVIPSYSYSCVNFRKIFHKVVSDLTDLSQDTKLKPLFLTFMDIVLKSLTVTAYTGYSFEDCAKDAIIFYKLIEAREQATEILNEADLVKNNEWKPFTYKPFEKTYSSSEAIAVLMYVNLIKMLNLKEQFHTINDILTEESILFAEDKNVEEIEEKLSRKINL